MNPKALQIATPTDTTIVLTRTFTAPRRLVWEAMFTPDKMRRWMLPPPGWTTTVCECEARVSGLLRLAWKSQEADPAMTGRVHGGGAARLGGSYRNNGSWVRPDDRLAA